MMNSLPLHRNGQKTVNGATIVQNAEQLIIWSKSWIVGCGYSFYKQGDGYHRYYACNYGPGGNVKGESVYKQGLPCSACPTNTQCSTSRTGPNSFPGLCKMRNPNTAPSYPRKQNGLLFYCGASSSDADCHAQVSGDGTWKNVRSVGGKYNSIVLSGGQSTTVTFKKPIKPHGDEFCLALNFRKGPIDASRMDASSLQTNFKMDYANASPQDLNPQTTSFKGFNIKVGWGMKTILGFTFSVPIGAGEHVLDIRKIEAYDGPCSRRRV